MIVTSPVAPGDLKTALDIHGHTHRDAHPSLSQHARDAEITALEKADAAAVKAAADAAKIKAEVARRHNCFTDAVAAFRESIAVVNTGNAQVADAQGDYDTNLAKLHAGVGNPSGVFRASWDFARQIAAERIGLEILKEAVAALPARREAAEAALRSCIKEHGISKELWPAELD